MFRHDQTRNPVNHVSIRAAAHNQRASGIAMPAVRFATGRPVMQRMIKEELFTIPLFSEINDLKTLHRFINLSELGKDFYFVNNRAQTFKQAVNEFIKTQSPRYLAVQDHWKQLLRAESVGIAKNQMSQIAEIINSVKSQYPDHPNAFWPGHEDEPAKGPQHESPGTIPQTPESRQIANVLWEKLNAEDETKKKEVLKGTTGFEGIQKENFMLGVLVFPNKHVIVSVSGHITALSSLKAICAEYVDGLGFVLDGVYDTENLTKEAQSHYAASFKRATGKEAGDFSKEGGDLGNKPGTCAAAVALGIKEALSPVNFQVRKPGAGGKVRLGLTEVFTGKSVTVSNRSIIGSGQRWPKDEIPGEYDVPSCETCQHQLHVPAGELVKLDREQRLTRYYPEQMKKLPESIKNVGEELKIKQKEKEEKDPLLEAAAKAARSKKKDLLAFQAEKEKELNKLRTDLRRSQDEFEAAARNLTFSKVADEQTATYCSNYLEARKPGNENKYKGKAAGYWWDEFKKGAPEMEKVDRGDRMKKATEFQVAASAKKSDSSGSGDGKLVLEIKRLEGQIGLIEQTMAQMEVESKAAALAKAGLKEEALKREKRVTDLRERMLALKDKLERYDDKIRREKAALGFLSA
jgi:hypothetical protein